MKLKSLLLAVMFFMPLVAVAQTSGASEHSLPTWALKTNVAYWGTATPNLGFEVGLGRKLTLDVASGYNMFSFNKGKKWRHWMVSPELRLWLCDRFNGHFFGIHALGGEYNVNRLGFNDHTKKNRYEGYMVGGGVAYGYHWVFRKRWAVEAELGVGYLHLDYDKYDCRKCGNPTGGDVRNLFTVTRLGINVIYLLK